MFCCCLCLQHHCALTNIKQECNFYLTITLYSCCFFPVGHCELFLYWLLCSCSLGGLDWFGIKVSLSIHRGLLLHVRGIAGIHIVRRDGSCYSTQAGHGDLEELCIKFLEFGRHQISQVDDDRNFNAVFLYRRHQKTHILPCVPKIQRFPRRACEKDVAPPLRSPRN